MPQQKEDAFTFGLSEAEKDDLEKMIGDFRRHRPQDCHVGRPENRSRPRWIVSPADWPM
jgi:hypothetical protein